MREKHFFVFKRIVDSFQIFVVFDLNLLFHPSIIDLESLAFHPFFLITILILSIDFIFLLFLTKISMQPH